MTMIIDGTNGGFFPSWTTGTRPASPTAGQMGYNTTTGKFDQYTAAGWTSISTQTTGQVLQVVQGTYNTYSGLTSSTWVDSGLTATITPTSSSSKILIIACMRAYANIGCDSGGIRLIKNSVTTIYLDSRVCLRDATSPGGDQIWNKTYLDSPATTSATTYKIQAQNTNANGTFYIMLDSDIATLTLMEVTA